MTKQQKTTMEDNEASATTFSDSSDICQQLFDRYGKSSATQHRHLCATAAATRSIIESESLPLTPFSYFAAAISTLADASRTLDSEALSALTSLLSIVLPLVPEKSIAPPKAANAISVVAKLMKRHKDAVSTSSAKAVVKCIGVLLGFCDLEEWSSLKLGFETLLKFSIDKRPKVRRCAQECITTVFKSIRASNVRKDASILVLSLLKSYMPLAVEMSASGSMDVPEVEIVSVPEHLEVIHMIILLKTIAPFLSVKVSMKVLSQLNKLMSPHFSLLTRHVFSYIEAVFETSKDEVVIFEADYIIKNLAPYLSLERKNPSDSMFCAAILLKTALDKLQTGDLSKWISNLPSVLGSMAGLLTSEDSTSSQASSILKELITSHVSSVLTTINKSVDEAEYAVESSAIKSTCSIFENLLNSSEEIPNGNTLDVISTLFRQLGELSYLYMKSTILRLAEMMALACRNKSDTKHLQECIGSAVVAIGPEKILKLLPINPDSEDLGCSNTWLIRILSKYVTGSSLGFFMEHIVPLAESFQQAGVKAKKSVIREDLQAHADDCWGLLPAFCRHPTDTYQNFGSLAALLASLLKKKSFAVENIATALQELVNPIKSALGSQDGDGESATLQKPSANNKTSIELESKPRHSKKTATRNMKSLASCSEKLLEALVDIFYSSPPEKRTYLKDAIGCLASISDSSVTQRIFTSLLERFQHAGDLAESGEQENHLDASAKQGQGNLACSKKVKERYLIVELASSFVQGASEDLVDSIYDLVKHTLQDNDKVGHKESYHTLARILEEHPWFCSSHVDELMAFLLGLKPPVDVTALGSRVGCFQILLIHSIEKSSDEENSNAFLVLNEIILTIKDPREEARKTAYDMLITMNSKLQGSSASCDDLYQKLISMIMGYLSSPSPQIKSGAVSALSILLFNNAETAALVPDLVPSVLALLQTKAVEVVKAVLGFVKVLVSSLQAKDLHNFLSDISNGILSWSTVSRHHFRAKVTVILEIMIRKCGCAAVESVVPEKHMNFVKSVLENRRGKSSSKETDNADHDLEVPESSPRRQQKRKHEDSSNRSEEHENGQSRFSRQDKRHKGFKTAIGNSRHNQSPGNLRNQRSFGRNGTNFRKNGEKQPTRGNKKFGATNHRFGSNSKSQKQRNFGRKPK